VIGRRQLVAGATLGMVATAATAEASEGGRRRGRVDSGSAWSEALGEQIRYRVYLPAGYGRERYASAYLLHGRGDDLDAWTRVAPQLDTMIHRGLLPPVVVVMPDAPWSGGGSWYVDSSFTGTPPGRPVETALTRDLVAHVDATYRTRADRSHRVVGGYSMGGAGALTHLLRHPDLFSGGLVLSPAVYDPLPPADSSTREFGAFGRGAERFVDEVYAASNAAGLLAAYTARDDAAPVRLFLAVGDDEWPNPLPEDARHDLDQETATVHNRAKRVAGVSSQLRVLDGGHDWDVWERALVAGLPYVLGVAEAGLP
jgi:enterochelin esterase-like enzyme